MLLNKRPSGYIAIGIIAVYASLLTDKTLPYYWLGYISALYSNIVSQI